MSKTDDIRPMAYTKGAKRRRKRNRISLPGGDTVPQPVGQGRRTDLDSGPPPIRAARAQRCAIDGGNPLHESDMGRCILALSQGQERADLDAAWSDLSMARRAYLMRIIGRTAEPQGAASPMITEAVETDPSLRVDLRTTAERDDAARRRWQDWQARIDALPTPQHKWAIRGALDGSLGQESLWRGGRPTSSGRMAVASLKRLTERR